jgi:hypothetical protein
MIPFKDFPTTILAQFNDEKYNPTQKTQNNISDPIRISLPPSKSFKSTQIQEKNH